MMMAYRISESDLQVERIKHLQFFKFHTDIRYRDPAHFQETLLLTGLLWSTLDFKHVKGN